MRDFVLMFSKGRIWQLPELRSEWPSVTVVLEGFKRNFSTIPALQRLGLQWQSAAENTALELAVSTSKEIPESKDVFWFSTSVTIS